MPLYTYRIINRNGQTETGSYQADSTAEVAQELKSVCRYILEIREAGISQLFSKLPQSNFSSLERMMFTDHLAAMVKSGTPLVEALETYIQDESGRKVAVVKSLIARISEGMPLSVALSAYPKIFSPLYTALVHAGEVSGTLDESLSYISKDLRRDHEFHERIKSALLYPAFVLAVAFIVISGLVVFVIPRLTEITQSFGDDMPVSTKIVSQISIWLSNYGGLVLLAIVGSLILLVVSLKKPSVKAKFNTLMLRLPLIGPLMRRYTVSRFLRILGGCIKNGVPLLQSFTIIQGVLGHQEYQEACKRLEHRIAKGNSLSIALTHEPTLFLPR
jgi:type II secretory pathway component PulF